MFELKDLLHSTKGRLLRQGREYKFPAISIDSRTIKAGDIFLAIKGDKFNGHDFIKEAVKKDALCIIAELPLSLALPKSISYIQVKDTTKALGDIARFQREKFDIPVIAVTGSNGKTTTKDMIAWVLSKRFKVLKNEGTKNNHIGVPLTLLRLNSSYDCVVTEIGTNHFGEVRYLAGIAKPTIGIITNIGPSHLEYFRSLRGVFKEKASLINDLLSPAVVILNRDDYFLKNKILAKDSKHFILGVGIEHESDFSGSLIKDFSGGLSFLINSQKRVKLDTIGRHNIYNAMFAIAAARVLGMSYQESIPRLKDFVFPEGRLKIIKRRGVNFIDDTYNSNPYSLRQALDALGNFKNSGRKIFVMGDMLELGQAKEELHSQAGIQAGGICDVLITVGKLSKLAGNKARMRGSRINDIINCDTAVVAREALFKKVLPTKNDIILVKGSRAMKMETILKL